jgi:hypothetical protein
MHVYRQTEFQKEKFVFSRGGGGRIRQNLETNSFRDMYMRKNDITAS